MIHICVLVHDERVVVALDRGDDGGGECLPIGTGATHDEAFSAARSTIDGLARLLDDAARAFSTAGFKPQ